MYILIFLYFLTRTFYLMESGVLQVFDIFFVINVGIFLVYKFDYINRIYSIVEKNIFNLFILFVAWTIIVNGAWYLIDGNGDINYLKSSAFLIYNLLFCIVNITLYLHNKRKYLTWFQAAIIINLGLNLAIYLLGLGRYYSDNRQIIYFNDPNQMGYYFFMIAMITFVLKLKYRYPIAALCTYFVIISGSRGVLMSLILFYSLFVIHQFIYERYIVRKYIKYVVLAAVISVTVFSGFLENVIYSQLNYVSNRFEETDKDDSILNRGYDRLYIYSQYILLGYGEGGVESGEKFAESPFPTNETHSTLANFLMSYGIVGLGLFLLMMNNSFEFKDYRYYLPYMAHGLIQVDSRQTTFWIFLLFVFVYNTEKKLKENRIRFGMHCPSESYA